MGNCLVTKLKGVVDNDRLPKLGFMYIGIKTVDPSQMSSDERRVRLQAKNEPVTITAEDGAYFTTSYAGLDNPSSRLTTITLNDPNNFTDIWIGNAAGKLVFPKYTPLDSLQVVKGQTWVDYLSFDDLKFMGVKNIQGNFTDGSITAVVNESLNTLSAWGPALETAKFEVLVRAVALRDLVMFDLTDDVSNIPTLPLLTSIRLSGNIYGDVVHLGKQPALNSCLLENGCHLTGSIEGFVSAAISAGHTTQSTPMTIDYFFAGDNQITFGGTVYHFPDMYVGYKAWIAWESASKITCYIGSYAYSTSARILAKGATEDEIAAW